MRTDLHFYATVSMPDAGADGPAVLGRCATNEEVVSTYADRCHRPRLAEHLAYDTGAPVA